mgnify:CR=1 FL=1
MNPPAFLYNCGDYVWCNKFGFLLKSVYFFCINELGTLAKLDSLSLKKTLRMKRFLSSIVVVVLVLAMAFPAIAKKTTCTRTLLWFPH